MPTVQGPRPESEPRKRPNPTPEQLAAREELAEARRKTLERKKRTRQLIQVGGVMAAWGIDSPEQAEELMRALTSAERKGWRRYLLGTLGARRTDRWPER
jgi:muconolactone delta-isomerase